jgi:hypothetical protein
MKTLFITLLIALAIIIPLVIVFVHAKLFAKQRVELSNDWSIFFKKWSTWLQIFGVGSTAWLDLLPDQALRLWQMMPDEWKATVPASWVKVLPMAFVIGSLVVSNIKQQRLAAQQAALNAVPTMPQVTAQVEQGLKQSIQRDYIGKQ